MDLTRIQPLGNFVLLQRLDDAVKEVGGVIIPEQAQKQSNKGRVIAVGEGRIIGGKLEPIPLTAGDIVLFSKYGGEDIELDGEEYILLRHDEVKLKLRLVLA